MCLHRYEKKLVYRIDKPDNSKVYTWQYICVYCGKVKYKDVWTKRSVCYPYSVKV